MTTELQPKPLENSAPHRRGFRARAHAQNRSGESAFSSRAIAASLVLHVTLMGAVGLSSVLAQSSAGESSEQSILFARSNDDPQLTDSHVRQKPPPIDEASPELHELMRELWKLEFRDTPPELAEPAAPKFPAPEPSLDDYWAPALSEIEEPLEPEPLLVSAPPPPYPSLARRMNWEGTVQCLIRVAPDGTVESVVIDQSSGHVILDEAALKAIRKWRFEPRSEPGELLHKVTFRIAALPNR